MLTGGWRPRKRVDFCPAITQGAWVAVCEEGVVALPRPLALGRRGALALALGAGALLAVRLDVPAFFDNEARYAEVAREMALGGDWISPHLDFTLFLNKPPLRSEEHTSELQSHSDLVCRLLLEKKKQTQQHHI